MSVDDMDEFTVQYAYAYGEWQYKEGYEQGKKDAVKHGHWIDYNYDVTCSVCGTQWDKDDYCYEAFKYCPECGSKMDGDTNEL